MILFCRERKLRLMIETKEYVDHHLLRKKIVDLYDKYDMYSWSFVATFNPWSVRWGTATGHGACFPEWFFAVAVARGGSRLSW